MQNYNVPPSSVVKGVRCLAAAAAMIFATRPLPTYTTNMFTLDAVLKVS